MTPKVIVLLLVSVSLGSVGQYFFKRGMMGQHTDGLEVIKLLFTPLVFTGLVCYGLATLTWLLILSQAPLSIAYPSISISYIVVVLMSKYVFNETVSWVSWVGVVIICCGVALVGVGGQLTKDAIHPSDVPPGQTASP